MVVRNRLQWQKDFFRRHQLVNKCLIRQGILTTKTKLKVKRRNFIHAFPHPLTILTACSWKVRSRYSDRLRDDSALVIFESDKWRRYGLPFDESETAWWRIYVSFLFVKKCWVYLVVESWYQKNDSIKKVDDNSDDQQEWTVISELWASRMQ